MDFSSLGAWIALPIGLVPLVAALVALVALRGTKPAERAEILLALAAFVAALVFRFRSPDRPPVEQPEPLAQQDQKTDQP